MWEWPNSGRSGYYSFLPQLIFLSLRLATSYNQPMVTGFVSLPHPAPSARENVFFDIVLCRRRGV